MRYLFAALACTALALSVTCCAAPLDEAEGEANDALSGGGVGNAGKESDDAIDVTDKDGNEFRGAFPSPTIVRDGSTYHAWMAKQRIGGKIYNIAHATLGADGTWKLQDDALPKLGAKAVHTGSYAVWAPAVEKVDASHWVLYYSSTLEGTAEKKCIWRATAASASGPFVDDFGGPIECLEGSLWAIDPYLVKSGGELWLAARLDEPGGVNTIKIRKLNGPGTGYAPGTTWKSLTRNSAKSWEQPVLENAAVVKLDPGGGGAPHWFVFYSGGAWANNSYAVGYADCGTSIDGPCDKRTVAGPWLDTNAKQDLYGPGTPTFYNDESGSTLMSVQAWEHSGGKGNPKNNGQIMRTYRVTVGPGYQPTATLVRVDR